MPHLSTSRSAVSPVVPMRRPLARREAVPVGLSPDRLSAWTRDLHDEITEFFTRLDGGGAFREDRWERPGGGGGISRVMEGGQTWEKAGVNWSAVEGEMPTAMAQHLGGHVPPGDAVHFFVTGVSVVVHPWSPLIPTVHLNVRVFVLSDSSGRQVDAWYGGGTDLTPTYPFQDDAEHFHTALHSICEQHDPAYYPRFKTWCDEYFVNKHRDGENRGVGGIFFDNLRLVGDGRSDPRVGRFVADVGRCFPAAYEPIVLRRRDIPYGDRERTLQLHRRGRYVEFNLVHDRGTLFGLQTNARIESVLMSLPPAAAWPYSPAYQPCSIEAELIEMLKPRDWVRPVVGREEPVVASAVA